MNTVALGNDWEAYAETNRPTSYKDNPIAWHTFKHAENCVALVMGCRLSIATESTLGDTLEDLLVIAHEAASAGIDSTQAQTKAHIIARSK